MTDLQTTPVRKNGHQSATDIAVGVQPVRRARRVRVPELAVGLIVMLGFGLGAVLWQLNSTQKDPVLALAHDVARGEVIERSDLRVVYLSTDDAIAHVGRSGAATIIGRVAASDIAAGTLLTPGSVLEGSVVAAGEGVVGLSLEPGQVPSSRLRAGDLVNVVEGISTRDASSDRAAAGDVIVSGAEVFAVEEMTAPGRVFVSLKTTEADANLIAAAAERGPVRLVWIGR
jgi:Flp pilus assembly protein CpaB